VLRGGAGMVWGWVFTELCCTVRCESRLVAIYGSCVESRAVGWTEVRIMYDARGWDGEWMGKEEGTFRL
jgi:hypothetical protein